MNKQHPSTDPELNVWLQLGFHDAETHFLKAELALRLHRRISALDLTQVQAAKRIGATQPELSKILRGRFSEVSLERLMRFLAALGHDIEIRVGAPARDRGEIVVSDTRKKAA